MPVHFISDFVATVSSAVPHLPEIAINAFIIFYLYFLWSWDLPESYVERRFMWNLRDFIIWIGLYHSWKMFAPDPATADRFLRVEFTQVDGTKEVWDFPRLDKMGLLESFLRVREGKFEEWLVDEVWASEPADFQIQPGYVEYLLSQPEWANKQVALVSLFRVIEFLPSPYEGEAVPDNCIQSMSEYIVPPERNAAIAAAKAVASASTSSIEKQHDKHDSDVAKDVEAEP